MEFMQGIFLKVINMSITSSYIIVFLALAGMLLKKAPKSILYMLWGIVLFRLVCPVSFTSQINFLSAAGIEGTEYIPQNISMMDKPEINSGIAAIDNTVNQSLPGAAPYASVNPMQVFEFAACVLWIAGIIVLVTYGILSFILFKRKLKTARRIENNIYESDKISTAFVLGFIKPAIYLPAGLSEREYSYILEHEKTHIKRLDHIVKPMAFLVLCVHWFNPFVWLAFSLMSRDMEMSCDEKVIGKMGGGYRKEYSYSLLALSQNKRLSAGNPLAFGENGTKARIKNVLSYKKTAAWGIAVLALLAAGIAVFLLGNPKPSAEGSVVLVENLGISLTFPSSWEGKYSIVYDLPESGSTDYAMVVRNNSGGGGILFWVNRLEGDMIEERDLRETIPGYANMYAFNGCTYFFSTPTDVQSPHIEMGQDAVDEYRAMYDSLPEIFNSIAPAEALPPHAQNDGFKFIGTGMFTAEIPENYLIEKSPDTSELAWQLGLSGQNIGKISFVPYDGREGGGEITEEYKLARIVHPEGRMAATIEAYDKTVSGETFNKIAESFTFRRLSGYNGIDFESTMYAYDFAGAKRLFGMIEGFTMDGGRPVGIRIKEMQLVYDASAPNGSYVKDLDSTAEYGINGAGIYPLVPPNYNNHNIYYLPSVDELIEADGKLKTPYGDMYYEFSLYGENITQIMGIYRP